MSYPVSEILEDVVHRNKNILSAFGEPYILRRMNKAYQRLNQKHKAVHKEYTADWTIYTSSTLVNYVSLPNDWIKPYFMAPLRDFRLPNVWRNDEKNTYTIDSSSGAKRIYVAEASTDLEILFRYYSMGLTLVRTISDADTEIDEPEWPEELKQLLFYETVLACGGELSQYELIEWRELKARMHSLQTSEYLQATGPHPNGPLARNSDIINPYTRTS